MRSSSRKSARSINDRPHVDGRTWLRHGTARLLRMSTTCVCRPWRLDDPERLLREVAEALPLEAGANYVAVVDLDGALLGVRRLGTDHVTGPDVSEVGRSTVQPAILDVVGTDSGVRPPSRVAHLLRCRIGRVTHAIDDLDWHRALSYGTQLLDTFIGDLIVLTPCGWMASDDQRGGLAPTLDDLARRGGRRASRPDALRRGSRGGLVAWMTDVGATEGYSAAW